MRMRFLIGSITVLIPRMSNELSRKLLALGGIDQEDAVKEILKKKFENHNSDECNNLMKTLSDLIAEQLSRARPVVYSRAVMSPLHQSRLSEIFPEFELNFTKSTSSRAHPVAANMRHCNLEMMLARVAYNNKEKVPDGYDAWVKDVGGNLRVATARAWYTVHCCIPVLDARDNSRRSAEMADVNRAAARNPSLAEELKNRSSHLYCRVPAERCGVKAPFLILNHSQYDMTNQQVADAMDSAAAELAYYGYVV